ncbi:non-ribosomal peptide synthase/polyketide synthase [Pseudomonas sp. NPDC087346]|uniref:non-ribosomal peptide synthase/polyketide synthase n=1 Tax=Pseudomonas sp. NPDC087346 TaxID=3364438 RepID=UPI0037FB7116
MQQLIESVGALSPEKRKALAILLGKQGINLYGIAPIFRRTEGEPLLLSYAQERQWFLWQMEPDSAAYHIPTALRLRGALDMAVLQRSFDTLIERHESLRTGFARGDQDKAIQLIKAPFALQMQIRELDGEVDEPRLRAAIEAEIARPFDLEQDALLRVCLLRLAPDDHVLVMVQHHIISDGWSMQVMVGELIELYAGFSRGTPATLAALPIQYADFAQWQRSWMDAGERERQLNYWVEHLGSDPGVLELPADHPRPLVQSYRGARLDLQLDAALSKGLQEIARREGVTMFMLLLASFQTLLHRYSGQDDIRIGVPIANRNRAETEGLIGFFVNTQVLRASLDSSMPFSALLAQAKQSALGAQAHQDLPFEQLVEALAPERSLSRSPLFQVMFNHQSGAKQSSQAMQLPGLSVESVNWDSLTAQFDLTLETHESPDGVWASLIYATDLFDGVSIERIGRHWQALLKGIVSNAQQRVGELPMLDASERQLMLHDWNRPDAPFASELCIHQLITRQAGQTPDALAVTFADRQLTYAQMEARANPLAHALIERGVGPEVRVGVAMQRSENLLVALLAVLKAGGVYVPLDPDYPADRVAYMLEDSRALCLLTERDVAASLAIGSGTDVLLMDNADSDFAAYPTHAPTSRVDADNLAYVIYTSGSTGKPKGVAIAHRNVLALIDWSQSVYSRDDIQGVLASTSVCFDLSVWELFVTLANGGSLIIARNALELPQLPARDQVRLINTVPSAIAALQRSGEIPSSVRIINLAGEPLKQSLVDTLYRQTTVEHVFDLYGPSEDTTYSTWTRRTAGGQPSIGRPLKHTASFVLDGELQPVPQGVAAELYLAGAGITRGYLARPGLTAEKYLPNPFGAPGERFYRTGDLTRYLADGNLQYVGRIDHQVKVRGFRIELGEIEARLLQQDVVRELAVLAQEGASGQQLVAYIVLNGALGDAQEQARLREVLKAALREHLPEYMVPAHLLFLEHLPLTPNGKLDRKALPKPDAALQQQTYLAPVNDSEQQLCEIWQAVLGLEQVGVTDNFFALGGDSIISIQVVSRARQAGLRITPKDLFQYQTVQGLARVAQRGEAAFSIDQGPVSGVTPLLPFQQRFFELEIPERQRWNQSLLLKPAQAVEAQVLEQALQALVQHHDALRLSFVEGADGWTATHRAPANQPLLQRVTVQHGDEIEAVCDAAQGSLDLQAGPLLRAVLLDVADGSQRLLLAIHHLVVDGVSWRVLLEDLQSACEQVQSGQTIKLAAKTSPFKAWAERLQAFAGGELQNELAWWAGQLGAASADLPCDNPDAGLQNQHVLSVETRLSADQTRQLLQQAPAAYRTQINDLLLTALARVICRWTGQASTLIQLEGHGREELFDDVDLSRTVGWFTSLFPVRLTPALALADSLKAVKEQLRSVPNKGLGFGALRYLGDEQARRTLAAQPVPRITFNYLGQFDSQFDEAALFVPASESTGREQSALAPLANWLDINGKVYGGELNLSWSFSREMFNEATIQRLADDYAQELNALIAHCCDPDNHGVTPSDFPLAALNQTQLDALLPQSESVDNVYPLSPMQQGMLFHTLYEQGSGDYINQMRVSVEGLDVERFRQAWQAALDAHDILRTRFVWGGEQAVPLQVVERSATLPFTVHDWRDQSADALDALADTERNRPFDLTQVPLLRLVVVRTGEDRHELLYTSHHILMDGWSNSQLLGEVLQRYAGQTPAATVGRYSDYIAWLQRQDSQVSERFWLERLAQFDEPTRLAQGLADHAANASGGAADQYQQWIDATGTLRLSEFARQQKVTLNTLVQAAWLLLLQRYTGQPTVAFGATVSGRPANLPGVEQQVGLFINTLPVIARPEPQLTVSQWLQTVQELNISLRDFEHTALADIQRWSGQGSDGLFDNLLVFENYPISEALEQGSSLGLNFGAVDTREQTNYPLTVGVNLGETLSVHYSFTPAHFSHGAIVRLHAQLASLLEQFVQSASARLGALTLLSSAEQVRLQDSNRAQPCTDPLLVQQRIALIATQHAEREAVRCGDQALTFAELDSASNRLAHLLIGEGVGPEVRVGVALPRSPSMLVALLAVLKAGGAYVPLDASYPRERLAYLIEDSGIALLLTDSQLRGQLPLSNGLHALDLDTLQTAGLPSTAPQVELHPENLAYVIYTSGSTGQPKGVCVAHGPLAMHCQAIGKRYEMTPDDCELHFMSFAFDGAHERWLTPLTHGSRLLLRDDSLWSPEQTYTAMQQHGVTVAAFPPVYLQQLAEHAEQAGNPPAVRIYCFGGDAVPNDSFERARAALSPDYIINGYGPTETVVTPLIWKAARNDVCGAAYAPIGTRIGDRSTCVLSADLNALPQGVMGELYLGGTGLARGYLDRPAMTAERFVPDPFGAPGARLYRSGDLVRERADGVFDYQGRVDNQVKIRGFRIELGEIEARLLELSSVREAVVLAHAGPSGKQLVAYLVPTQPVEDALPGQWRDSVRNSLKESLPAHMVPAHLMVLAQLPVTPNGKLDRKALPAPDASLMQNSYVAPRNELEQRIAAIWADVLRLERVSATDNFFELGGDSIISIQVVGRARQAGIQFTPKDLFQHQTVQALAAVAQLGGAGLTIDQGPVSGMTPLLPFQQLFFASDIPERHHWNQSLLLKPGMVLQADTVEQVLQALVVHHDALRLSFSENAAGWIASHRSAQIVPDMLWHRSLSDIGDIEAICQQAQASLDLQNGPLLRGVLLDLPDQTQRLLLIVHHLVVDGVSWRVLLEDLQTAFSQVRAGRGVELPAKTSAFKAWAERLQAHAANLDGELAFWQEHLQGSAATLPCERTDGSLENRYAQSVQTRLAPDLTRQLLQQAPAAYRTQVNDLLLTALARVISRWSGHASALIQLEGHGREDLFDDIDLSRTLGWFTSVFPVHLTPANGLGDSIKQIKEQLRAIPDKGIGFGALRYLGNDSARAVLAQLPSPRITFNYLGQFDSQFDESALFMPASESAGSDLSERAPLGNWLSVNGQVYGGELSLSWSFSEQMFDTATVQALADDYGRELALLIEHCLAPDNHGLTPSDFPLASLSQARLDGLPVPVVDIEDIYPLSPMQQGMLFHTLSDDGDDLYVNQLNLSVEGLDIERFRAAWECVVQRHEILRTSFHWQDSQASPVQVVHRQGSVDLQALDTPMDEAQLAEFARQQRVQGFELNRMPLQRTRLIRLGADKYQLIWTSHHILMDGWSSSQLFGEVLQHYATGQVEGESGRYRDFIAWLQKQDSAQLEQFWKGHLQTLVEPTALSQAMHPRHESSEHGHQAIYTRWDANQTAVLQQHCRAQGITANTLIQGAWLMVLQRYTGQHSVAFGATVAGRPEGLPNAGSMLGLFINTLPVIQTLDPAQPLNTWLSQLQAYNLDLREHAHAPLADIQRWSGQGGQPLFDSIIVFENYPIDQRLEQAPGGLRFGTSASHDVTNFPMDLAVHLGEEFSIEYLFLRDRFSVEAVERIRLTMEVLLHAMMHTPEACLGNLQRLAEPQWQALQQWGAEPAAVHRRDLLPALIAAQRPEAIAAECGDEQLSYAQLERRANQLAHHLIAAGAGPEVLIGVALERSIDMLVALLAVFKSGAAYVPLDIDYPSERLAFMIEDSGMRQMISRGAASQRLPLPAGLPLLDLDHFDASQYPLTTPRVQAVEDSLAYLIYTSGSTGLPKGVAVTHGPLSMHCQAIRELYEMDHTTRELHFMSFAFDGAHERWLTTLAFGGTLVLRDHELWTPEQTSHALLNRSIDIACFPPAYLKQVAEYVEASGMVVPKVRIYCLGGDAVPEQTLAQVRRVLQPQFITNGYGPTETVVTPMLWKAANDEACAAAYAPIGRVVGQRSLWVLDDDLNPLPQDLSGQLYIGGYGVARGYHGRAAITAERFVPDPFGAPGSRLYRSGDLVRLRADGILDYVGRADHQVKIRGFRIELGEIEACLRAQSGVTDAVVIARDGVSGKQLIGYVVSDNDNAGDRLKTLLRSQLPEYMVPLQIICLARLPISPNGKLDRKALPEPEFSADQYQAPRNDEETWLAGIWADVLQVERVGISDNFFELGGDSILSLQVISRARNHPQLKLEIKLRDLMRFQTIGNLFDQQAVAQSSQTVDSTHVAQAGGFGLLPIQEWFFAEGMSEPHHFNQAMMLRSRQPLDSVALERTMRLMLEQHDSLRLRFFQDQGRWLQHYQSLDDSLRNATQDPLLWQRQIGDIEQLAALVNETQRSLNLVDGPLMRGLLVNLPDGEVRLLLVVHHLVIDAVSWRIFLQDLQLSYEAFSQSREPQLAQRTSSYRAWADGLAAQVPALVEQELDYWLGQLDQPGKDLPCDNPRGKNLVRLREETFMGLDATRTGQLLKQAPAVYGTQINDLLLTALGRVLCRWSDAESVLVQLEGHGREDLVEGLDLSRTLGWFTTMFPVRLAPLAGQDFGASILAVREQLAAVPQKGVGYGALRYMAGAPVQQQLAALPQARLTFNYLGQFDQTFDEQAMLLPADEHIGDVYSLDANLGNWLEIVGQVFDGKLSMRCMYSTRRFRPSTIETLMQAYQTELEALVEHCLQQSVV